MRFRFYNESANRMIFQKKDIMLASGFYDDNQKEIYQDDILKIDHNEFIFNGMKSFGRLTQKTCDSITVYYKVVFEDCALGIRFKHYSNVLMVRYIKDLFHTDDLKNIEIVGNMKNIPKWLTIGDIN